MKSLRLEPLIAAVAIVLIVCGTCVLLWGSDDAKVPVITGIMTLLALLPRVFKIAPPARADAYDTDDDERDDPTPALTPRAMDRRDRPPGDHSRRGGWAKAETLLFLGLSFLLAIGAWLALDGCGGASAETRARYSLEAARCVANERSIVDREGTTEAQDRADMTAERARCDAALAEIEAAQ